MRRAHAEPVKRELPSNYCHRCRRWVESQERVELLASVDGEPRRPVVWICPECRGVPGAAVVESRGPVTQADVSRDERYGPLRGGSPPSPTTTGAGTSRPSSAATR